MIREKNAYALPYAVVAAAFKLAKTEGPFQNKLILYPSNAYGAPRAIAAASSGTVAGFYGAVAIIGKPKPVILEHVANAAAPLGAFADMAKSFAGVKNDKDKKVWAIVTPNRGQISLAATFGDLTVVSAFRELANTRSVELPVHVVALRQDKSELIADMRKLGGRDFPTALPTSVVDMSSYEAAGAFLKAVGAPNVVNFSNGILACPHPFAMTRSVSLPAAEFGCELPRKVRNILG